MTCPTCKAKHVYRLTQRESGKWECAYCPVKQPTKQKNGLFIRAITGNPNSRRTVAHDNDISRRRLAEDGRTVIRV